MRKLLLSCILATLMSLTYGQEKVGLQITQDAKLGIVGDQKHGYEAGTLDVAVSILIQGHQQKYGYMIVYPEFEYADLQIKSYRRWTVNVGYVLNELIVSKAEVGASLSYGFIDRGLTEFCWGLNTFAKYKISDSFKVVLNAQLTERPDLDILYNDPNEIRISGQVGLEFTIFNKNK